MIIQPMTITAPTPPAQTISGIAELNHLGVIRAVGPDAAAFLQGQLTQDVLNMGLDTARLAAFCNAKGRMQASFVVFKRKNDGGEEEFLLVCSADILTQTLKRLSMFVMRSKVKLSDASSEFLLFGLVGDVANAIQSGANRAGTPWSKHDFEGQNAVFLYPGAGVGRVLCCAPMGTQAPAGQPLSLSVWQWLEVQSGIAMVTQALFEAFVPQMLNYESVGGVSFKKGCYPGQEVVARSQFRGTLKRRAYLVHGPINGTVHPSVGQEVFHSSDAEQPCGLVAACAANPAGGFDAIVSMRTSALEDGQLTLGSAQGVALTVIPLPYPLLDDI
jgi:folate-binding protein YgfZ